MAKSGMLDMLVRRRGWPAALVLAAAFWLLAVSAVKDKSNTFDEIAHLTAGYSYWITNTYGLNPENGNLPQRLAALPLLAFACRFPPPDDPDIRQGNAWDAGRKFFFELDNPIQKMLLASRAVMALTGAAIVLLVFFWSRGLWGVRGAVLSAVLAAFCPTLLANAPLVTSDATAALFFLLATGLVWKMLHRISVATVLAAAAAIGCLFLSKMAAPLIIPVLAALCLVRLIWGPPLEIIFLKKKVRLRRRSSQCGALAGALCIASLAAWLMLWGAFGFSDRGQQSPAVWEAIGSRQEITPRLAAWAHEHELLPEPYLFGFSYAMIMSQRRAAFLNGEYSAQGWPYFFIYSFLVKTPLPVFFILLLALGAALPRRRAKGPGFSASIKKRAYKLAPLVCFALVYGAAALATHLNIGHRHILPLYPVLYILAGAAGCRPRGAAKSGRWVAFAAAALLVFETLVAWPNYIAYFNILAGGPKNAYKHLVDSSLDWGQDLDGLMKWIAQAGLDQAGAPPVYISYFGTAKIRPSGASVRLLPGFFDQSDPSDSLQPLTAGVYCISATMLQCVYIQQAPGPVWRNAYERVYRYLRQVVEQHGPGAATGNSPDPGMQQNALKSFGPVRFARLCTYLRRREPDAQIGYSILIYYVTQAQIDEALAVSDLPAGHG